MDLTGRRLVARELDAGLGLVPSVAPAESSGLDSARASREAVPVLGRHLFPSQGATEASSDVCGSQSDDAGEVLGIAPFVDIADYNEASKGLFASEGYVPVCRATWFIVDRGM